MRLKLLHPRHKLYEHRQFTAEMENRIRDIMERRLTQAKTSSGLECRTNGKECLLILKLSSGYSYIRSEEGKKYTIDSSGETGRKIGSGFLQEERTKARLQSA